MMTKMSESLPRDLLSLSYAHQIPAMSTRGASGDMETTLLTWKVTSLLGLNPNKPTNRSHVTTLQPLYANAQIPPIVTAVHAHMTASPDTKC
jgi:hypothetical protein